MATITNHLKEYATVPVPPGMIIKSIEIDFSATGNSVSAADVVQIFNVAKGTTVLAVFTNVKIAEGGTCTIDIGDSTTTNGYDASVDLNSATTAVRPHSTDGTDASVGKYYTAADTIDIVMGHDTDAAKVEFTLVGFMDSMVN